MATNKVKVKVTKKKINIKRIVITLFILSAIFFVISYIFNYPIKNIYITGNNIVDDKTIIKLSGLENYPSFIKSYFSKIDKLVENNDYIKEASIKRKFLGKIYIEVIEERPLFIYQDKLVLSSNKSVENIYNIDYVPYVMNDISSIYQKVLEKFNLINDDILLKISEISYEPNEIDKERLLFTMIDNNYVYVTLNKIEKINKYNKVVSELSGKKGIIYLDSGDYIEIKD